MTTIHRSALITDLENVVTPTYNALGATGAGDYLRWVHGYVSSRATLGWSIAAAAGRLPAQLLPTLIDLGLHVRRSPRRKNGADDLLIRHGRDLPQSVSQAILLTGDSDFIPLVRSLQARDVPVVVASTAGALSAELRAVADCYWDIPMWPGHEDLALGA